MENITIEVINELIKYEKIVELMNEKLSLTKKVIDKGDDLVSGESYEIYHNDDLLYKVQESRFIGDFYYFTEYGKKILTEMFLDCFLNQSSSVKIN